MSFDIALCTKTQKEVASEFKGHSLKCVVQICTTAHDRLMQRRMDAIAFHSPGCPTNMDMNNSNYNITKNLYKSCWKTNIVMSTVTVERSTLYIYM